MGQVGEKRAKIALELLQQSFKIVQEAQRCLKMVPRWPQNGPRWSKISFSGCLGLSYLAVSGVPWLCLRFALALPSFCLCFALALPLLCLRFAFVLPLLCLPFSFRLGVAPLSYKALLKRLQDLMYIDKPYLFRGISRSARTY